MKRGALDCAWIATGLLIFVATMIYPIGAASIAAARDWRAFSPSLTLSYRLLGHSLLMALSASILALAIALPAAYWLGQQAGRSVSSGMAALLAAPLLFPPMVYVFGWSGLLHAKGELLCVAVWATWMWPVHAAILGAAWARRARSVWEAALVDTSPQWAALRAVLPVLAPQALGSIMLVAAFLFGEYTTPHACGLIVFATDLLARSEAASTPWDVIGAALPGGFIITCLLAIALWMARDQRAAEETAANTTRSGGRAIGVAVMAFITITLGVPLVALACRVPLMASISTTLHTYSFELSASVGAALAAGLLAILMGAAATAIGRLRWPALAWAVLWAALPGGLIGELIVGAYLPIAAVYDSPLLTILGWTARFGWIGIATAWLARASTGRDIEHAAALDGATAATITRRVILGSNMPLLAAGFLMVAALSLADVATTSLVRTPGFMPISMVLIEKFHRMEDGILVAISLLLVLASIPGMICAGWAASRR
jgi:ABC-type Fe3+ transport system permease subunit